MSAIRSSCLRVGHALGRVLALWSGPLILLPLVAYPLASVLMRVVVPGVDRNPVRWGLSLRTFVAAGQDPLLGIAVRHTVVLAGSVAIAGTILGTILALALHWHRPHGARLFQGAMWVLFFTPSFVIAEGWEIWAMPGGLAEHLGISPGVEAWVLSPVGIGMVLSLRLFPLAMMAVGNALESMGREYVDAARVLGAGYWRRQFRVVLPLLVPAMAAGGFLIFAEAVGDFGVAATLGNASHFLLLSYLVFQALTQFPANFALAGVFALAMGGLVLVAQLASRARRGRIQLVLVHGHRIVRTRGRRQWVATILLLLPLAAALGIPLVTYAWVSLLPAMTVTTDIWHITGANYVTALSQAGISQALARSVGYGLFAGLVTVGLSIALAMTGREQARWLTMQILTATIAVPGLVLGIAYVFAYNAPWLVSHGVDLYGTRWALGLAYIAGALPFAVRLVVRAVYQVDPELLAAARVLGAGPAMRIRRILVPAVWPSIGTAFLLVFTGVLFELPVSELLYPAGYPTLAVVILHLFDSFQDGAGAALTLLGMAVAALATAGLGALGAWRISAVRRLPSAFEQREGGYRQVEIEGWEG